MALSVQWVRLPDYALSLISTTSRPRICPPKLYRYFPAADGGANPGGTLAHGAPFAAKS
jgi:hypothetical protein